MARRFDVLDFEETVSDFQRFLQQEGRPTKLAWVFQEDVTEDGEHVCLPWPLPKRNDRAARALFEISQKRGLGVELDAFGVMDGCSCCYILVPQDAREAELLMMYNPKYFVLVDPIPLRKKSRGIRGWWAHFWKAPQAQRRTPAPFPSDLPRRSDWRI